MDEVEKPYAKCLMDLMDADKRAHIKIYTFKPLQLMRVHYDDKTEECFPSERSDHRVVVTDSHLYLLGGYNPAPILVLDTGGREILKELWSFNLALKRWSLLMSVKQYDDFMPVELMSHALMKCQSALISFGGTATLNYVHSSNACVVYNVGIRPHVGRMATTGDAPLPRYSSAIVMHQQFMYTIGGKSHMGQFCDVYRLNLLTRVWQNMYHSHVEDDDPLPRYCHEVAYDGKYIYVLGGCNHSEQYGFERILAFDLQLNNWQYFETYPDRFSKAFPQARRNFTCVQHTNNAGQLEAFIMGGLHLRANKSGLPLSDIWRINLHSMQWYCISTKLCQPIQLHAAAASSNGCMYIFGGIQLNENQQPRRCNHLYKFWMTIPKLSEICWDAICNYNHQQANLCNPELLFSGKIPQHFLERLKQTPNLS